MTPDIHVVVNPASASGAGGAMVPALEAALKARGIEYVLHTTLEPLHGIALTRDAVAAGARRILAVGGDGTVHEVANGLLGADGGDGVALAVLPVGTGNDFYRMVGAPATVEGALDMLENGRSASFDVGLARWDGGRRYFVNLAGMGIDVEVIRRRERFRRLRGLTQYLAALLSAVVGYEAIRIRVEVDENVVFEDATTLTAVTVGPSVAGGFLVSPGAIPSDGLLDLCFVEALGYLQVVLCLPRVIRGTHGNLGVVRMERLRRARFEAPDATPFHFQLDGEVMDKTTAWLEVAVVPSRLTVLVPGGDS